MVDQPGDPDDNGHRDGAELGEVGQGAVEKLDQLVDDLVGTQAAGVNRGAPLAHGLAGEVNGEGASRG